jgi:adenosylcobinamide-GDP ribazoletransferase
VSRASDAARLALGTLTVLPVRPPRRVDGAVGGLAMTLAPLAVLPVAVTCGAVVWLGEALLAPPLLTAVAAVAVLALGSGGLHLDGLADTADGLAAPRDRAGRLQVMRSGDVGPAGAATLLLVVLVQVSALAGIVAERSRSEAAAAVVLAVVVSRVAVTLGCVRGMPAARGDGLGSAVAGSVSGPVAVLVAAGIATLAGAVHGGHGLAGILLAGACAGLVLLRAWRRLGGVTGDVLGACVELALAGYLAAQVLTLPG